MKFEGKDSAALLTSRPILMVCRVLPCLRRGELRPGNIWSKAYRVWSIVNGMFCIAFFYPELWKLFSRRYPKYLLYYNALCTSIQCPAETVSVYIVYAKYIVELRE
jgi:hypothetical protein